MEAEQNLKSEVEQFQVLYKRAWLCIPIYVLSAAV